MSIDKGQEINVNFVNSSGEWLLPSTEGTKIIPLGQISASACAS